MTSMNLALKGNQLYSHCHQTRLVLCIFPALVNFNPTMMGGETFFVCMIYVYNFIASLFELTTTLKIPVTMSAETDSDD
jgi:hypothetical protein